MVPPLTPLPSSPHGPARPPRSPCARRRSSPYMIQFMIFVMNTLLDPGSAMLDIPAALPPEEAPIMSTPTQDLNFTIDVDNITPLMRGEPPGGYDDGMTEDDETLH